MSCFTLIWGLALLLGAAAIHVLWLETAYLLGELDEDESQDDPLNPNETRALLPRIANPSPVGSHSNAE